MTKELPFKRFNYHYFKSRCVERGTSFQWKVWQKCGIVKIRDTFFRLEVYQRVGNSRVEVLKAKKSLKSFKRVFN